VVFSSLICGKYAPAAQAYPTAIDIRIIVRYLMNVKFWLIILSFNFYRLMIILWAYFFLIIYSTNEMLFTIGIYQPFTTLVNVYAINMIPVF
jgi:hypothetical protein